MRARETGFVEVVVVPDEPCRHFEAGRTTSGDRAGDRRQDAAADSADHATDTGGGDGEGAGRLMVPSSEPRCGSGWLSAGPKCVAECKALLCRFRRRGVGIRMPAIFMSFAVAAAI